MSRVLPETEPQWNEWRARLLVFVREFGGPGALEAEDTVHEIVERVIDRSDLFDGKHSFSTWVYRIARNYCVDLYRKGRRRREVIQRHGPDLVSRDGSLYDPVERLEHAETGGEVKQAISRLRPADRQITFLRYSAELSVAEIAVVMGKPAGTVKYRLHVIVNTLRRELAGVSAEEAR